MRMLTDLLPFAFAIMGRGLALLTAGCPLLTQASPEISLLAYIPFSVFMLQ